MFDRVRNFVMKRRHAYRALFQPGGQLSPAAHIVLSDLRKFCRATVSTTMVSPITQQVDPIASAQAEGRREVWLRITQHLHVDDADIYRMIDQQDRQENDQ